MSNTLDLLQSFQAGTINLPDLFQGLAKSQGIILVAHQPGKADHLVTVSPSEQEESKLVVLFTDELSVMRSGMSGEIETTKVPLLLVLARVLALGAGGIALNPTRSSGLSFDADHVRLLFREAALVEISAQEGAWVGISDGRPLAVPVGENRYMVPAYLSEDMARFALGQHKGEFGKVGPEMLLRRLREIGGEGLLVQGGLPEQVGVPFPLVRELAGEPSPLPALEAALREGVKGDNTEAVCKALAELDEIWTLVDADGDIVSFSGVLDLFATPVHAEEFMQDKRAKAPEAISGMHPRRFPALGLFRAVHDSALPVGVNRGSLWAWNGDQRALPLIHRLAEERLARVLRGQA